MNDIKEFHHTRLGDLRAVIYKNLPWFVGADICKALGIANPADVYKYLDDDDKIKDTIPTDHGNRKYTFVSVFGIYAVIYYSNSPNAQSYHRWISHVVLPDVRNMIPLSTEEQLAQAEQMLQRLKRHVKAKKKEIEDMEPKAQWFDEIVEMRLLKTLRETANILDIRLDALVSYLTERGFMYFDDKRNVQPFSPFIEDGWFVLKGNDESPMVFVTPKGVESLRLLMDPSVLRSE